MSDQQRSDDFAFLDIDRNPVPYRLPATRVDFFDVADLKGLRNGNYDNQVKTQAKRCTGCGMPWCHTDFGCPIYNLIPDWLAAIKVDNWHGALRLLEKTNDFPEFTGRICPAPCEGSCTHQELGSVTIKNAEFHIVGMGFRKGWIVAKPPKFRTGKRVAIIGSGPAGLAAANQLNQAGHQVDVYEQADEIGGLLFYGIPTVKLEKWMVHRRVNLMKEEGVNFITRTRVGSAEEFAPWHQAAMCEGLKTITLKSLQDKYDAVLIATGAALPRSITAYRQSKILPGHNLSGIHFAMEYLTKCTQDILAKRELRISAKGLNVVILGAGDTASDCAAYALRSDAESIHIFDTYPLRPEKRAENNPWPQQPDIFTIDYAVADCIEKYGYDPRVYEVSATGFIGKGGRVSEIQYGHILRNNGQISFSTAGRYKADLVLIATGFTGAETIPTLSYSPDQQVISVKGEGCQTSIDGVFATGDCTRGASLVVWAIHDGRTAAKSIDEHLMGSSSLPG